jgi:hypothetical protein
VKRVHVAQALPLTQLETPQPVLPTPCTLLAFLLLRLHGQLWQWRLMRRTALLPTQRALPRSQRVVLSPYARRAVLTQQLQPVALPRGLTRLLSIGSR